MQAVKLYQKYSGGRHWENHPTTYASDFASFLKKNLFSGTVVDVGCGTGRDVNFFNSNGISAMGVDISQNEVEEARKRFPEWDFDVQNAESLKFRDSSVDAFYMINVIHYVDARKAIAEASRCLRPLGHFFVHFNLEIIDKDGNMDYNTDIQDAHLLMSKFKPLQQKIFVRIDKEPIEHNHRILEIIAQKTE
jgi:ubiquinone/menaquinone biosynthesis C-methylase UbiE